MGQGNDRRWSHRRIRALIAIAIAFVLGLAWLEIPAFRNWEYLTLDLRFRHLSPKVAMHPDIVVVDINDASLKFLGKEYGRWPLPRRLYKEILEFVRQGEPRAIYFDIQFGEEQLGGTDDAVFAEALAAMPEVSMAMSFLQNPSSDDSGIAPLPERARAHALNFEGAAAHRPYHDGLRDFVVPHAKLLDASARLHVVSTLVDRDGRYRRTPLFVDYAGKFYPSLALAAARDALGIDPKWPVRFERNELQIGNGANRRRIPVDAAGVLALDFYPRAFEPTTILLAPLVESAAQVMHGEVEDPTQLAVNPEVFRNKIVLIGVSALGASDLKPSPVSEALPGVLIHATALSNILQQRYLRVPTGFGAATLNALLAAGLAAITYLSIFRFSRTLWRIAAPLIALALVTLITLGAFYAFSWVGVLILPALVVTLALVDGLGYMTFVEGRERRRMEESLSKYLPPAVIQEMVRTGKDLHAEIGKKEKLSILFSDIRGFTTLSEEQPPEVVVGILNEYLDAMTGILFAHNGTLDKFIGDAIMAFWGAPIASPHHAFDAVQGALAMVDGLNALQARWAATGRYPGLNLAIGVGINTGEVIVGNIGGEKKLDYTVIGDNVNLASRLEGLTKQYGVTVVIGENTHAEVSERVVCRLVDLVQVKGKNRAVAIYEPLALVASPAAARAKRFAEEFSEARGHYERGELAKALELFAQIKNVAGEPDRLSAIYVERCQHHLATGLPADWNGVYKAVSK